MESTEYVSHLEPSTEYVSHLALSTEHVLDPASPSECASRLAPSTEYVPDLVSSMEYVSHLEPSTEYVSQVRKGNGSILKTDDEGSNGPKSSEDGRIRQVSGKYSTKIGDWATRTLWDVFCDVMQETKFLRYLMEQHRSSGLWLEDIEFSVPYDSSQCKVCLNLDYDLFSPVEGDDIWRSIVTDIIHLKQSELHGCPICALVLRGIVGCLSNSSVNAHFDSDVLLEAGEIGLFLAPSQPIKVAVFEFSEYKIELKIFTQPCQWSHNG
jgi:hypothetical protein